MPKQRRLADLFVVGKELTLDDGQGPVTVWIQKLNPVDHENATRKASAARARVLANPEEREAARDEILDMSRDELIQYLAADLVGRRRAAIEAEFAAEEEWDKDGYLQGLRDSWDEGLSDEYAKDPEDEEAARVFGELKRFEEQVETAVQRELESAQKDFAGKSDDDLVDLVADKQMGMRADLAWLSEFRRCEVWLSVRDPENHREKYFESRDEVDLLSQEVLVTIIGAYRELSVDPVEGKGSPGQPGSSASSDPQAEVEEASGREGAAA